jgi:excisionase family DNA binding protein
VFSLSAASADTDTLNNPLYKWRFTIQTIYTIPEVANYLKMSKSKVCSLVQTCEMSHLKIGCNVCIPEADLKAWLEKYINQNEQ